MSRFRIPFNKAGLAGKELDYIAQAIHRGHISGDGEFTRRCERLLEDWLGARRVFLTTSCTHALEMAALLLDVGPGDEVILPSFTFVSTANAFALRGARPVFVDIRPDTLNMDVTHLERLITARTKAIVPVHYAGVGCEMHAILATAERHGIEVIEDNAHGLGGRHRGRYLGTFGALAVQSFHETKNFTCGEGGALVVNAEAYVDRAEILREKGTDRARFFRGQVDKYTWADVGSSYVPSDILGAFLYAQLEAHATIYAKRQRLWDAYAERLGPWAARMGVALPTVPPDSEQAYHMFYLILPTLAARTRFIAHLRARDILSVFHYVPLHLSPMGRRFGGQPGDCPITEDVSERLVRLPFYTDLTNEEQADVCTAIAELSDGW